MFREKKIFVALFFALLLLACQKPTVTYQGVGVIEEVHKDTATVQINHEEIKGLMPAMSMPYRVKDKALLDAATPGDKIDFTVEDGSAGIFLIELKKAEEKPKSDAPPANANQSSKIPN